MNKHHALKKDPGYARRHRVDKVPPSVRDKLLADVQREVDRTPAGLALGGASFMERLGDKVRRMFAA